MIKKSYLLAFIFILIGCSCKTMVYHEDNVKNILQVKEGILCPSSKKIIYKRNGEKIALIKLSDAVCVAQAEKEESWGFFQFPTISKSNDGVIYVNWQMAEDTHKSYGLKTGRSISMKSNNKGLNWSPQSENYFAFNKDYYVFLHDNSKLGIHTPPSKDINRYNKFPAPLSKKGNYYYYLMDSLPQDLQGVYLNLWDKNNNYKLIHSKLEDNKLLRYSIDNLMPIVWWGDIKKLSDNSLIAGVYPTIYQNKSGDVTHSSVSFYRSNDMGISWVRKCIIPVCQDGILNKYGDNRFDEPTFEILADSTFICVMRSGTISPMYKTFSYDKGETWTTPKPFTPNGVKPHLFLLDNGILVLVSGRPGIQIRFDFEGSGKTWSDPIDMISFINKDGSYNRDVSCGYASILVDGRDSFYIVYSDFSTKNSHGEIRKSIICRRVTVKKIIN